jgi:hypothetical protein
MDKNNRRIHPNIVAALLRHNIWLPDYSNLTTNQKKKNEACVYAGPKFWRAILRGAGRAEYCKYLGDDYSSTRERNREVVAELLSKLIKHQDTGYYYFYPEFYLANKRLCYEFFAAWQLKINATRRKKDGWCWHWHIVGDHRIKMMEIK